MAPRAVPLIALCLAGLQVVTAQTPGTPPEVHPLLKTYRCTNAGGCIRRTSVVVLDDLSHWVLKQTIRR
jgi:cellulase